MSQAGPIDIIGSNPTISTEFITDNGTAIPILNQLEILGDVAPAGTDPLSTSGSGNTVTVLAQISQAIAATDATKIGLSAFDSANFTVDANGFVSLVGGGLAIDSLGVQATSGTGTDPVLPTVGGLIELEGALVAAGTNPLRATSTAVNTVQYQIQTSQALAAADSTKVGLANFDAAAFDVDVNGFVQLNGGGIASTSFDVQANTVPGTDPVVPTALGVVTVNGAVVANHSVVLESRSRAANAYNLEVQYAGSAATTTANLAGVASFDSDHFTVDSSGFVSLLGGGAAIDQVNVDANTGPGTDPVVPDSNGQITVTGAQVANGTVGTNVIRTNSLAANTYTIEVQRSTSNATTDVSKNGVAHFNSTQFTVDANGFVALAGAGLAIDSVGTQTGTNPITPTAAGLITINGAVVAAGTNPIRSNGTGANTLALEVQTSQALAAADATKIGLSNFDSSSFAVAATGFVTLSTTGAGKTITGDTGGALSPTANNWNILGGPGVTISGSGSTLTVNSVVYTNTTAATLAVDNGYFATAAGTYPMPATAAQGELIEIVCDTSGAVVLDCPALNFIRIGSLITSSGGTVTSTSIGDSLTLRYRLSTLTWECTSCVGTWVVA
jgi:hypothetical protein